jgi:hypothetical protein
MVVGSGKKRTGRLFVLSFATDIRPLFTPRDIAHMKGVDSEFDLSDYDSVKEHSDDILDRLTDGSMPPGEPWPDRDIARFKQWMDEGFPA